MNPAPHDLKALARITLWLLLALTLGLLAVVTG